MQTFLENLQFLATSGHHNSAMITDHRKLTAKINLYGMSSFHFLLSKSIQSHSPDSTLRTGMYIPQTFRCEWLDADHSITRYICNHQEAPWTIYMQQMGAIILFTITDSNCAKNNFDYR